MVHFYEGHLPDSVAKDFEFSEAFRERGFHRLEEEIFYEDPALIPEKDYLAASHKAKDNAVENIRSVAEGLNRERRPNEKTELIADLNVIREERGSEEIEGRFHPTFSLCAEALGYKRKGIY